MASSLSEIYPQNQVEVMNSDEFKDWLVSEYFIFFKDRESVDAFLKSALLDPIPCAWRRPSLAQYNLSRGRERVRENLGGWAQQYLNRKGVTC